VSELGDSNDWLEQATHAGQPLAQAATATKLFKVACANDARCASFTDPSDFVRTVAGDDWDTVEELAGEIDAKLDAGRWDELGLGF
jgi:hypothetical protein